MYYSASMTQCAYPKGLASRHINIDFTPLVRKKTLFVAPWVLFPVNSDRLLFKLKQSEIFSVIWLGDRHNC